MNEKVAIIILNWNGKKLLDECFLSLTLQTYKNFEVFFVDNGSQDDSIKFLNEHWLNKLPIKIISLKENTGFAKGNNLALLEIKKNPEFKYVICLNNDTKCSANFIEELVKTTQQDEHIGAVASKMMFYYEPELIDNVGVVICNDGGGMNRGFKEKDVGQYEKEEEVFGPCAGAALYTLAAIDKCGFFDDAFFAYYEDLDLAWRLRYFGYKTIYNPRAVVAHVHSATGVSHSPFKAFLVQRNRLFVMLKNYPFWQFLYAFFVLTPFRYLHLLNSAIGKKQGPSYKLKQKAGTSQLFIITLKAWLSFFRYSPTIIKGRFNTPINRKKYQEFIEKYSVDLDKMIYL